MTGRKSFSGRAGVSSPMAAIVIVIIVCASGVGIVELQLSSANSGRLDVSTSTVTVTVTQTAQSSLGVAQVAVTAANLRSADFLYTNPIIYFTCGSAAGSFLTLSSTGTAGTSVTAATINWA